MTMLDRARRVGRILRRAAGGGASETQMLLLGKLLADRSKLMGTPRSLAEVEFKVFSQFGDDGIIQWLVHNVELPNKTFIEFGVEDYRESNTRFLMMNDNWSGLVMDGSEANVREIVESEYYWKYDLTAKAAFIDCENINALLASRGFDRDVGILHIDLDGNDYWIWKRIEVVSPVIVIVEYNSVFGIDRALTIPYDPTFVRNRAHSSNLYWGTSLSALHRLADDKAYGFIGCNSGGNNAYFVRADKLNAVVKEVSLADGYVVSRFRESRNEAGQLTYASGSDRLDLIRGMPAYNVDTGCVEPI